MDGELTRQTAAGLAAAMAAGEVSAVEVTQAHLDRIDRGGRACEGVPARRGGPGPGGRAGGRRPAGRGRAARPAGRRADRAQGRVHHRGHADHLRIEDPGGLAAALRRDRDPAAARGRDDHPGQDQHGRVRDGLVDGELRVRPVAQPMGPRPGARRVLRRVVRRGRRVRGAAGHRHRHRRVDPAAGRGVRDRRGQADLRRLVPVRPGRVRVVAGHAGPAGPDRAGRRAAARGHVRARPVRLDLAGRGGAPGGRRGPAGRRQRACAWAWSPNWAARATSRA